MIFKTLNSINKFFMKEKNHVDIKKKNNNVLYIQKNMKKNRIILPKKGVYNTYEFPAGFIKKLKIKDKLKTQD